MNGVKKGMALLIALLTAILPLSFAAQAAGTLPVTVNAKSAVLMDVASGRVLAAQNENEKCYPASVTKVMALLLVMEALDEGKIALSDKVAASETAAGKGGSQIWLAPGETMTVDELLRATAIYSANDACTALGEYVAGSSEAFVNRMNQRAAELGMSNTHFDNCTGLDDETTTHLTTARDVAVMSRELLKHERITNYSTVWMDSLRGGKTELVNTNKLIRFFEGATGLKTGTTAKAGCCIAASAKRGDTHLIAVVMGAGNSNDRFNGAKALLNWGFSNYETVIPETSPDLIPDVTVIKGVECSVTPVMKASPPVLIKKGSAGEMKQTIDLAVNVEAPVVEGQLLGTVTYTLGKTTLGTARLVAPKAVARLTFGVVFRRMLTALTA